MSILRADSIRDRAGTGAPNFPNGLTGNVTGTASTATLANTATVATNAQGLTGTPNIIVGTISCGNISCDAITSGANISATDATFSGNLTVQGTTTTIDTAVTAVDSLSVDGSIGIGDTTPENALTIKNIGSFDGDANSFYLGSNFTGTGVNFSGSGKHAQRFFFNNASGNGYLRYENTGTTGTAGNPITWQERFRITSGGTAIFKAGLAEKYNTGTTLAAASNNVALTSGNVHRFTSNESGAKTVNFTGVHSTLADGESVSFTVLVTPANAGYINAATVDGVAPGGGLKWSGGSAPSAGGASGRDVYTFTIFKAGTATNSYEIFGAVTNYA